MPFQRVDGKPMTEEETIRAYALFFNIPLDEAAFIYDIERGEIDGDIVIVDENGREVVDKSSDR